MNRRLAGSRRCVILTGAFAVTTFVTASQLTAAPTKEKTKEPTNLAPAAEITASGQYSTSYEARFLADGKIPVAGCKNDTGQAWCLPQNQAVGATVTFQWPTSVTIAEIVYYGRTAWLANENFLQVQAYADDGDKPVADAVLKTGHGPQRVTLKDPIHAKKLTLKFPRADKGPNPGASEICIYPSSLPEAAFPRLASAEVRPPDAPATGEAAELADKLLQGKLGFQRILFVQRHAIRPTHVYTYHCEGLQPGGGLYVYDFATGEITKLVDASKGVILDCDLSYDGKEVLFSWMKQMQPFQVYRMAIDGSGLTQLTDGPSYNFNACWLPDGGIAFLSTRRSAYAYCWSSPAGILHRMDREGAKVRQLSANYLNDFTPSVLGDGRIIYSRWEYVDRPAIPIQSLWTINPDGTGLRAYYGNRVLSPATFMEPRAIPGTSDVLCMLTAHNGPCRGAIGIIDRRHGINAQQAIQNLTPNVRIGEVDKGNGNSVRGPYESLYPIDENFFFASREGTLVVRGYTGTEEATVLEKGKLGAFNAVPIRQRRRPPVIASAPPDEQNDPAWATLYLQDVYRGLEPHVKRGEIKQIRVVEEIAKPVSVNPSQRMFGFQFPVVSCGATYAPKRIWGTAQVEADGSASFRVPANVPIYFMALDAEGRAVQRMRSFTHLAPGESQGCIGCHEHRLHTASPPGRPHAVLRSPQELTQPEWGLTGFSYPEIVQPVLDQHCVQCHNAREHPGGLDLTGDKTDVFNVSYELLARKDTPAEDPRRGGARMADFRNPYTSWIPTYNGSEDNILTITPRAWGSPASPLAELIHSGHPDENGRKRVELSAAERRRIYAWIDCNVPYYPTSASNDINRPGCRQIYPPKLDEVLASVAQRRCAACHEGGKIPRAFYTRITRPRDNSFLLAPLARAAGGTEACGQPVFETTDDPDYRAILDTFQAVEQVLQKNPRLDMSDAQCPDSCSADG